MNPKFLWPLGCAGALVMGWIAGFIMGGTPEVGDHTATASHAPSPALPAEKITISSRQDSTAATDDEGKERLQSILGAMRDRAHYMRRKRDLYDAILKMSPGEMASAVAVAQKLPKKNHYELLCPLVDRWTESDPADVEIVDYH